MTCHLFTYCSIRNLMSWPTGLNETKQFFFSFFFKNDIIKDQLNLLKYELKEKDLDIVQLQKEINELQLDKKMLKARMPVTSLHDEHNMSDENGDKNSPLVSVCILFLVYWQS